jgi:hypothetical protein
MTRQPIGRGRARPGRRWRWDLVATAGLLLVGPGFAASRSAAPGKATAGGEAAVTYVDLQPRANQKQNETLISVPGNTLAGLKQGKQTLAGLRFDVGPRLIQLANEELRGKLPGKVEGIQIGAKFARLHVLHGTAYFADDGAVIARYVVHDADNSKETVEVVYGKDVRDWWRHDDDKGPTRGKVAWEGSNPAAKAGGCSLWLFSLTWKNPRPGQRVLAIDCVSTLTDAAPFVVAMTLEGKD